MRTLFLALSAMVMLCVTTKSNGQVHQDSCTVNIFISPIQQTVIASDVADTLVDPISAVQDSVFSYVVYIALNDTTGVVDIDIDLKSDTTIVLSDSFAFDATPTGINQSFNRTGNTLFIGMGHFPYTHEPSCDIVIKDENGVALPTITYTKD